MYPLTARPPSSTAEDRWMSTYMRFRPRLRAVDSAVGNVARSFAPCAKRNRSEISIGGFIMCRPCSPMLFVKGTAGSCWKRSVSVSKGRNRNAGLCPSLPFLHRFRPGPTCRSGPRPSSYSSASATQAVVALRKARDQPQIQGKALRAGRLHRHPGRLVHVVRPSLYPFLEMSRCVSVLALTRRGVSTDTCLARPPWWPPSTTRTSRIALPTKCILHFSPDRRKPSCCLSQLASHVALG